MSQSDKDKEKKKKKKQSILEAEIMRIMEKSIPVLCVDNVLGSNP